VTVTISRRIEFDAGHRLLGHESKCRNVHGHRYVAEVSATAAKLDAVGRVIDFSVLKSIVGNWVDDHWDHGFIAQEGDPIIQWLRDNSMKHVVLPFPPTAENLSAHLRMVATGLMTPLGIEVCGVKLWETPNCSAVSER